MENRGIPQSLYMPMGYTTRHQGRKISDIVEFCHQTITTPVVTPEDYILRGLTTLIDALTDDPTTQSDSQRQAIAALCEAYDSWETPNERPYPAILIPSPTPAQTRCAMKILERKMKQTNITQQPAPRFPNKMARYDPYPRKTIHQHVPSPSPRVNPKETSP